MSDTSPTVKPKLKIRGVLKSVSDSAAIATGVADLVKSWLGSNLEAARGDPELLLELCRKIEESSKTVRSKQHFDKKEVVLLVLQELFPTITEPELVQASSLIEFYCLYRLVDKKGLLVRVVKAISRFFFVTHPAGSKLQFAARATAYIAKTATTNMCHAYLATWVLEILAAHKVSALLITMIAIAL